VLRSPILLWALFARITNFYKRMLDLRTGPGRRPHFPHFGKSLGCGADYWTAQAHHSRQLVHAGAPMSDWYLSWDHAVSLLNRQTTKSLPALVTRQIAWELNGKFDEFKPAEMLPKIDPRKPMPVLVGRRFTTRRRGSCSGKLLSTSENRKIMPR
jgi:hypothetical protein